MGSSLGFGSALRDLVSQKEDWRPIRTRFRSGSPAYTYRLTKPRQATRRLILQEARDQDYTA